MSVKIEKNEAIWTVVLSRPEASNAIDPDTAEALYEAFLEFNQDESAKVAVLCGDGGVFCAGWDLKEAATLNDDEFFESRNMPDDDSQMPPALLGPTRLTLDKPVIAAIAGPAVAGGMELALWCDFRVMEKSSFFGVYCRRWGIPLIDGGTVRLPRLVGEGRAREIVLTGRKVEAKEAIIIGLCEYMVEDGQSRESAEKLALEIASHPQHCVRADRRSLINQYGKSVREAMTYEWFNGREALFNEGLTGAARFSESKQKN